MKIKIITVGRLKASPLRELCDEYIKRLGWPVKIEEIDSPKAATSAIEAPLILKHIPENAFVVALDERGQSFSSPEFAEKLSRWRDQAPGNEIILLIGGADGFDKTVRDKAKILLSFGKQTWPHMLVRVMLLEQIYRAQQILAGHPYHRA